MLGETWCKKLRARGSGPRGTRAAHVPYNQFPKAIADLLSGTNQFMFITTLPIVDLIASGKLRALL